MANISGWWKIEFVSTDSASDAAIELSDTDLEHIAGLVKEGFTEGEIVSDLEDNNNEGEQ